MLPLLVGKAVLRPQRPEALLGCQGASMACALPKRVLTVHALEHCAHCVNLSAMELFTP